MGASVEPAAAGGVVWRGAGADLEVLLVHRPSYDDWSLPKGKPDPGENLLHTAAREVHEETGLPVTIGPRLGSVSYPVKRRTKTVWYWSMRVDPGCTDDPHSLDADEVDDFAWLPLDLASRRVTYPADRRILSTFGEVGTVPVSLILIRHGRAGSRSQWPGPDDARPLAEKGLAQAAAIGSTVPSFAPRRLLSAPPPRSPRPPGCGSRTNRSSRTTRGSAPPPARSPRWRSWPAPVTGWSRSARAT